MMIFDVILPAFLAGVWAVVAYASGRARYDGTALLFVLMMALALLTAYRHAAALVGG